MTLPYENRTLLSASIARAQACCARIILVLGYRAEELLDQYANQAALTVVINPTPEAGLFSSITMGLQHLQYPYVFLTHGDMPHIPPETFHSLWAARGNQVLFPTYEGKTGHPVLLPQKIAQRMGQTLSEESPKKWLLQQPHSFLAQPSDGILFDIDTPNEYKAALKKCSKRPEPLF